MKENITSVLCAVFVSVVSGAIGAFLTFAIAMRLEIFSDPDCTLVFIWSVLAVGFIIGAIFGLFFYFKLQSKMLPRKKNDN
jgi:quinol-cytochrome oxidoreductase complex cytochrome b subunit